MKTIDINCDLGEGGDFDARLMPHISTCNIACGGHSGTVKTVAETVRLAIKYKVKIGAHPSYPDRENFGRRSMRLSAKELKNEVQRQVLIVREALKEYGEKLHHVKPHGALYNDIVTDEEKAKTVLEAVLEIDESLMLFVPPKSKIQDLANGKITTWVEGFADRNYNPDYSLVSRQKSKAVLTDRTQILQRIFTLVFDGEIRAIDGRYLPADFDTVCLHSDTENAVEIMQFLAKELPLENITIL